MKPILIVLIVLSLLVGLKPCPEGQYITNDQYQAFLALDTTPGVGHFITTVSEINAVFAPYPSTLYGKMQLDIPQGKLSILALHLFQTAKKCKVQGGGTGWTGRGVVDFFGGLGWYAPQKWP